MIKIVAICANGVVGADGKTYQITEFSRKRIQTQGVKNAYISTVGGFTAVCYKK